MNISKIRDNLYLCGYLDINQSSIDSIGITAVVNVAIEINTPNLSSSVKRFKFGFKDNYKDAEAYSDEPTKAIIKLLNQGEIVLVHCIQGVSRSPHIVACVLSEIENFSYQSSYQKVIALHSKTLEYSIGEEISDKNGYNYSEMKGFQK